MPKKPNGAKKPKKTPIEHLQHHDTRTNIPTSEQSALAGGKPETMRYPRDTSLDPQLVWKGKDEQDGQDLEVPNVPIYIQETIHPKAIVEDLRTRADAEEISETPTCSRT